MTICTFSPYLFLEVILPLILTIGIYFFVLKKRFVNSSRRMLKIFSIFILSFLALVAIGSITSINLGVGCAGPELRLEDFCSRKSDCYARADICECVNKEFYVYTENSSCENFGCDCVNRRCIKTEPLGK